jgi:hypothetical protein
MIHSIPPPNAGSIQAACEEFDRSEKLVESALDDLFRQYPKNVEPQHILLKVVAVNSLYSTSIYAVKTVAEHIHGHVPDLDCMLSSGSPDAVERISQVKIGEKNFKFLSFASKFCSWHFPHLFPIYDSRVERYLWTLQKQRPFTGVLHRHEDLWLYPNFHKIVSDFRTAFGLNQFSFKEIDKFIYSYVGFDVAPKSEGRQIADVV